MQLKKIGIAVSSRVLQKDQKAVFVILKVWWFFIEKDYVIKNFTLKRT